MAETARVFGTPGVVEHKGVKYKQSPITNDMWGLWEVWLEERAWRRVQRTKAKCSPQEYQERLDTIGRLVASEAFAWNGPLSVKAMDAEAGQCYLAFLALSLNPDMSEELAREIYDGDRAGFVAKQTSLDGQSPNG